MPTILAFGDSNTHGSRAIPRTGERLRHEPRDRWTEVMAAALGATVLAEGQPGRTAVHDDPVEGAHKNGLRVLPALLESHRPIDLVVVMLGTNDCKARFGQRGWDIAQGVARLGRIVLASDAGPGWRAPDLMLVAPVPLEEAGVMAEPFQGAPARSRAIAPALRDEAERLNCGFFDAGRVCAVDPVDGVHLTAEGQRALGLALADAISERLGKGTR
jgi:lysophospholipase L1-like esterase